MCRLKGFKIIPDIRVSNSTLPDLMAEIFEYKSPIKRFNKTKDSDLVFFQGQKVFETKITKEDIQFFYYSENEADKDLFKKHFNKCTIKSCKPEKIELANTQVEELELKYHYFMALSTDMRSLAPLSSVLESQKILKDGESVIIQTILVPLPYDWYAQCDDAYNRYKEGKLNINNSTGVEKIGRELAKGVASIGLGVGNLVQELVGGAEDVKRLEIDNSEVRKRVGRYRPISRATLEKSKHSAYNMTLRVLVSSKDEERRNTIAHNVSGSYHSIAQDNQLVAQRKSLTTKFKNPHKAYMRRIQNREGSLNFNRNIVNTIEVAKFFQLPTMTYQEMYKLGRVDTREVSISNLIREGGIGLGTASLLGQKIKTYWYNHRDYITLPKIFVGGMGSGKSTYVVNFCIDAYKQGHGLLLFDYIKECEVAEKVKKHVNKKDIVEIELADLLANHSLSYPELIPEEDATLETLLKNASSFSGQIIYLINALNDGSVNPLTAHMKRILNDSSQLCYLAGYYRIYDVIEVLENHVFRHEVINKVLERGIYTEDYYKIRDLYDLDDIKKIKEDGETREEVVGTQRNKVDRILDRVNVLLSNLYLERMLMNKAENQLSFVDLMNEGKVVLVKMRQSQFSDTWVKDVLVTYYLSRVWLATLLRGTQAEPRICHVVTDEIHQLENAVKVLFEHITESRKFGVGYTFTCQFLKQFRNLLEGIEGAKANYVLMSGTHKNNFTWLAEECGDFTLTELLRMAEYHALNIIQTSDGIQRFICRMPPKR